MNRKTLILSLGVLLTIFLLSNNQILKTVTYSNQQNDSDINLPKLSYNATSPVEFFNETSFPRYNLVARYFGMIEYPNKANPAIVIFNEEFKVITTSPSNSTGWNFTLVDGGVSISLDIIDSSYLENKWYFRVLPETPRAGLYDLQLNCSEGSDYQTHSVQIVEEKNYPFTFVHISDLHLPAYDDEDLNSTDIVLEEFENIKALNPDFVILTGDLIQGPSTFFVNPETGKALAGEIQLRLALWILDTLNLPVYYIHGNHEFSQSHILPDIIEEVWYNYLGPIRYQNFTFLDWTFVGFGSSFEGLNSAEILKLREILAQNSDGATVLYYHYDFDGDATSFLSRYPIEVALYGHIHEEMLYEQSDILFHCQEPLFHRGYVLFTITDENSLTINSQVYDFELVPYVPPETSNAPLGLVSIISSLSVFVYVLKRKRK